jgi:hypothetical protein
MKKNKKRFILFLAICLLLTYANPLTAYAADTQESSLEVSIDPPCVKVYGVTIDAPAPFVRDGVVWAPFRAIAEAYHMRVEWGADTLIRHGEWEDNTVLYIDYHGLVSSFTADGENAVIVDGRTFAPVEYIKSLGFEENNIISRLGYSKAYITTLPGEREVYGNYFPDPGTAWNLRSVTRGLPYPIFFRYYGCDTHTAPVNSIDISYESYDNPYPGGNGLDPFRETISENNALILFATIGGLEQANFLYYFNGEQNRAESYTLNDLSKRFGPVSPMDMDVNQLYDALSKNFQISEFYFAHYSRIYLGANYEEVSYRNAEPDEIIRRPDGSVIWKYMGLGKTSDDPGCTAYYYFNSPSAIADAGLTGLYATKFSVADGESYLELTSYLGFPDIIKGMGGGDKYIAYPLRDGQKKHAYFILHNDIVITDGVMYGDDYALLNIEQTAV